MNLLVLSDGPGHARIKSAPYAGTGLDEGANRTTYNALQSSFCLAKSMLAGDGGGNEHIVHVLYVVDVHVCRPFVPLCSGLNIKTKT